MWLAHYHLSNNNNKQYNCVIIIVYPILLLKATRSAVDMRQWPTDAHGPGPPRYTHLTQARCTAARRPGGPPPT